MSERFKYYLFVRPLAIGTYPRENVVETESWVPKKRTPGFPNLDVFGFVVYDKKLTFEQIYNFELVPANKEEYAKYHIWERSDKNYEQAEKIETRYMGMSVEELEQYKHMDIYAYYILLLLDKI